MSGLFKQLDFDKCSPEKPENNILPDIPKEMEIYYINEDFFLPNGKTFSDLTPSEKKLLRAKYRFSYFRPGVYQTLSGFEKMI